MTFDDAMASLRSAPSVLTKKHGITYGARVRRVGMGDGWSVFYIRKGNAKGFYCRNPHTGSNYAFTPVGSDKKDTTWEFVL